MLDFETLQGFWVLLLIPLLAVLQRHRRRPRRALLTVFPIVAALLAAPAKQIPLLLRLARRYRQALTALAISLLALAFNGTHLHLRQPEPAEWLLVVDTPRTAGGTVGGRRVLDAVKTALSRLSGDLPASDRLRVVLTCPEPRLFRVPEDGTLASLAAGVEPAASAPEVDALLDHVDGISAGRALQARIVLSPRAPAWRTALARRGQLGTYRVPDDLSVSRGNLGVVGFDLRPMPDQEGVFRLFFEVAREGLDRPRIQATLSNGSKIVDSRRLDFPASGRTRQSWDALRLEKGPLTLAIDANDGFPDDDRVEAGVGAPTPVTVALHGKPPPFLRQALEAHEGFRLTDSGGGASVDVYTHDAPAPITHPTLLVQPQKGAAGIDLLGLVENPGDAVLHPTHPITRSVRLRGFRPTKTYSLALPAGLSPLATAGSAALLAAGTVGGQRVVVWNFDPSDRGLFLDPAYPILARESVEWLAGGADATWSRLGCDGRPEATPKEAGAGTNILCPEVTALAAAISLPDVGVLLDPFPRKRVMRPLDLTPHLLLAALPLLFLASLASAFPSEGRDP